MNINYKDITSQYNAKRQIFETVYGRMFCLVQSYLWPQVNEAHFNLDKTKPFPCSLFRQTQHGLSTLLYAQHISTHHLLSEPLNTITHVLVA